MTMHIDEQVLADVMALTGAASKTEAVELALRDLARRHRQRQMLREGLQLTPEQREAEALPRAYDDLDGADIDHEAVRRFIEATDPARPDRRGFLGLAAEPQARYAAASRKPKSGGPEQPGAKA